MLDVTCAMSSVTEMIQVENEEFDELYNADAHSNFVVGCDEAMITALDIVERYQRVIDELHEHFMLRDVRDAVAACVDAVDVADWLTEIATKDCDKQLSFHDVETPTAPAATFVLAAGRCTPSLMNSDGQDGENKMTTMCSEGELQLADAYLDEGVVGIDDSLFEEIF